MRISTSLRDHSKVVRKHATAAMKDGGADQPWEYGKLTNIVYQHVLGTNANGLRRRLGLTKGDCIRDYLSQVDLASVMLAEAMVGEMSINGSPPSEGDIRRIARISGSARETYRG